MPSQIFPKINCKAIAGKICLFLSKEFKKRNKTVAVVGVSGGVDSSLTAKLCEMAGLELKKVFMPYGRSYGRSSYHPASEFLEINIAPVVDLLTGDKPDKINKGNIMARVRMIILYDLARKSNGLVIGTENLSEYYLGYFTLHGDRASDINPIAGLWKTQVIELAEYFDLPVREPSAELWQGQTDKAELGFSYEQADPILYLYCVKKLAPRKIIKDFDLKPDLVYRIVERVKNTEYKRREVPRYEPK